jgi:hypothetical protein
VEHLAPVIQGPPSCLIHNLKSLSLLGRADVIE